MEIGECRRTKIFGLFGRLQKGQLPLGDYKYHRLTDQTADRMREKTSSHHPIVTFAFLCPELELQVKCLLQIMDAYGLKKIPCQGRPTRVTDHHKDLSLIWWNAFGRNLLRPIVVEHFSSTEVLILIVSSDKEIFFNEFLSQEIYKTVSDPNLIDVTVLVVVTSAAEDVEERISVDAVKQEFHKTSLMFPHQDWHFMESPTVDKGVMEEVARLAERRRNEKESTKCEFLSYPSSDGKMGKLKSKFISFWKNVLSY